MAIPQANNDKQIFPMLKRPHSINWAHPHWDNNNCCHLTNCYEALPNFCWGRNTILLWYRFIYYCDLGRIYSYFLGGFIITTRTRKNKNKKKCKQTTSALLMVTLSPHVGPRQRGEKGVWRTTTPQKSTMLNKLLIQSFQKGEGITF